MTASTKDITFPHKKLSKLGQDAEPTATEVRLLQQEVHANAASVGTTLGGGNHDHLGLVMPNVQCAALGAASTPAFIRPPRPPLPAHHGAAGVVATARENHDNSLHIHVTCNNVDNKLKQLIINAVDPIYIKVLSNQLLGYTNVTAAQLLSHIVNTCGEITQDDLAENVNKLEAPWDPATPYKALVI